MEKQRNRGQDGAGIAVAKLNVEPGYQFMHRKRFTGSDAISKIFGTVREEVEEFEKMYPDIRKHPGLLKGYLHFMGEVMLGHLRYGTQGRNNIAFCHPFLKSHINPTLNLAMAGNFNIVNTDELFDMLHAHPTTTMRESDLGAIIETIYYYLSKENEKDPQHLDLENILKQSVSHFDGGFVCGGLVGNGDSFIIRDANGIRPGYYYKDDEIIVAASERPAIMTTFNVPLEEVHEVKAGHAVIVKANGDFSEVRIMPERESASCSFERIYFSRGNDPDIYHERMQLGRNVAQKVLESVDYNLKNTIVSFIPNTAETAFYGLIKGMEDYLNDIKLQRIRTRGKEMSEDEMLELISRRVRIEKIAIKDVKLRTFITEDSSRNEMVQHAYDITYNTVEEGVDTLVVIDDSIVRGTTLRESIIKMLDRLHPKRIVIVSSAPQIRYPDCYGIDMSRMGDFIAFQAAIELLKDTGKAHIMEDVYKQCKDAEAAGKLDEENFVKGIYAPFTPDEISNKIAVMLKSEEVNSYVDIIYQSIEGLWDACPENHGDWYFTGNYPTKGGNRVANRAFMNYLDKKAVRGY